MNQMCYCCRKLVKMVIFMRADARADARELSLVKTGHMGADFWERMQERMRESGFNSCDVSEPIRCAKVVSAPENLLPHPLWHPLLHPLPFVM